MSLTVALADRFLHYNKKGALQFILSRSDIHCPAAVNTFCILKMTVIYSRGHTVLQYTERQSNTMSSHGIC